MRLADWEEVLDNFLRHNDLPLLRHAGSVSRKQAEQIAHARYAQFDARRKEAQKAEAERMDELEELKRIARTVEGRGKEVRDG